MNPNRLSILVAIVLIGICGCAGLQRDTAEPAESGETKLRLDETPAAVRQAIESELVEAQL